MNRQNFRNAAAMRVFSMLAALGFSSEQEREDARMQANNNAKRRDGTFTRPKFDRILRNKKKKIAKMSRRRNRS